MTNIPSLTDVVHRVRVVQALAQLAEHAPPSNGAAAGLPQPTWVFFDYIKICWTNWTVPTSARRVRSWTVLKTEFGYPAHSRACPEAAN